MADKVGRRRAGPPAARIAFAVGLALLGGCDARPRPSILFIMIDTLRADHLGSYGYPRDTSPHFDAIAERGVLFSNFYSVSNWTNPAIASLFTGRFPLAVWPPTRHEEAIVLALPSEIETLPEALQAAGYRTVALVEHPGIGTSLGFGRGFDEFVPLHKKWGEPGPLWNRVDSEHVRREVAGALDRAAGERFFLYLHVVYPHRPYGPPAPYDTMFGDGYEEVRQQEKQGLVNMYDAEIRYTDELVGHLFADLEARALLDDTWIVVTSDHGEEFWEHGLDEHGATFFNEVLRIPLLLYPPGGRSAEPPRVDARRSLIDLFPTLAEIAGVDLPEGTAGSSLLPCLRRGCPEDGRPIFSESAHTYDLAAVAVIRDRLKLIHMPGVRGDQNLMFDLVDDPDERKNIATEQPQLALELYAEVRRHRAESTEERLQLAVQRGELDEQAIEGLRALGYLD